MFQLKQYSTALNHLGNGPDGEEALSINSSTSLCDGVADGGTISGVDGNEDGVDAVLDGTICCIDAHHSTEA